MKCVDAQEIVAKVKCRDLTFRVIEEWAGGPAFLQAEAQRPNVDLVPQIDTLEKGRKWRLSDHMTSSELVQTCFAAALHFEEHELREAFTYRGQAVFGPHFDVDDLVALAAVRGKAGARP